MLASAIVCAVKFVNPFARHQHHLTSLQNRLMSIKIFSCILLSSSCSNFGPNATFNVCASDYHPQILSKSIHCSCKAKKYIWHGTENGTNKV